MIDAFYKQYKVDWQKPFDDSDANSVNPIITEKKCIYFDYKNLVEFTSGNDSYSDVSIADFYSETKVNTKATPGVSGSHASVITYIVEVAYKPEDVAKAEKDLNAFMKKCK